MSSKQRRATCIKLAESELPTRFGRFRLLVYRSGSDRIDHVALVMGTLSSDLSTPVRIHSECLTGDVLGSLRCDCGDQLDSALAYMQSANCGVLIYLRGQEGRGIGLAAKIRAYSLQESGADTVDANLLLGLPVDSRNYEAATWILDDLGVGPIDLLTNNPAKVDAFAGWTHPVQTVPLRVPPSSCNEGYLLTKQNRMHHDLGLGPSW